MRQKPIYIIFKKNNEGGILVPVLAILFMFTFLALLVAEDYKIRREILGNTKDFYLAKAMEEMTWNDIISDNSVKKTSFYYNKGKVRVVELGENGEIELQTQLTNQYKRTTTRSLNKNR